jgi:hypothetical protein
MKIKINKQELLEEVRIKDGFGNTIQHNVSFGGVDKSIERYQPKNVKKYTDELNKQFGEDAVKNFQTNAAKNSSELNEKIKNAIPKYDHPTKDDYNSYQSIKLFNKEKEHTLNRKNEKVYKRAKDDNFDGYPYAKIETSDKIINGQKVRNIDWVGSEKKGIGIGTRLIKAIEKHAQKDRKISLLDRSHRLDGKSFYTKFGINNGVLNRNIIKKIPDEKLIKI